MAATVGCMETGGGSGSATASATAVDPLVLDVCSPPLSAGSSMSDIAAVCSAVSED